MRLYNQALLLTLSASLHAEAWTSDVALRVAQPGTPTATVLNLAADAEGGHRAVIERSDGRMDILHFDAAQGLVSVRNRPQGDDIAAPYSRSKLVVLEDGSLYALSSTNTLARLKADGAVAWASNPQYYRCERAVGAPGAVLWTLCLDRFDDMAIQRTDAVGRTRIRYELPIGVMTALDLASDGGVFFSDYLGGGASIGRFAADGSTRWYGTPVSLQGVAVWAMLELENGHVLLVGQVLGQPRLKLMERDQAAGLVSQTDIELGFPSREILLARREADGSLLLLIDRGVEGADVLVQIKPDRSLGWIHALPAEMEVENSQLDRHALLRTDDLETRLIARKFITIDEGFRTQYSYLAIGADGQRRIERLLGDERDFLEFEPRPLQGDFLTAGRYARIDADGQVVDLALPGIYIGQEQPKVLAAYSDGDERFVVVDTAQDRRLQAWTRSGELRWSAPLQRDVALLGESGPQARLQVADVALCFSAEDINATLSVFERLPVECFERSGGTPLHRFEPEPQPVLSLQGDHLLLAGGVMARLERAGDGLAVRFQSVVDGSDVRPSRVLAWIASPGLEGTSGGVGVHFAHGPGSEVQWFDGLEPHSANYPHGEFSQFGAHVLAEGMLLGNQWYPRSGSPAPELIAGAGSIAQVNDDGHPVVLLMRTWSGELTLAGFEPSAGSIQWGRAVPELEGFHDLRLARGSGAVHLLPDHNGLDDDIDLDIISYDRATGQPLDRRSIECGGGPCRFMVDGPIAAPDGLDLLLLRQQADGTRALRALHLASDLPALPPDQSGIAGLWYHPGLQGHGLVLTYVEGTRTVFAPWFTYRNYHQRWDESDLSWYSFQGDVQPGAEMVSLELLRNVGGSFATPPTTSSQVVGQAELRLVSCDRATLSLGYDPEYSLERPAQIPLIRLGPRTRPCVRADGSVDPPRLAAVDQAGFSIRQSGAWFDPATSGQGIMLEVVPPGPTQNGLLFGAWFTYDRAGSGNDVDAQDWFILQADLAEGALGHVEVPIYRSIGGEKLQRPTSNLFAVGSAELKFNSCTRLTVAYQFDDGPLAGAHAGLAGQLELARIGGCNKQ